MPVRVGKPKKLSGLVDEIKDPIYAAATGLIIFGLKNQSTSSAASPGRVFSGVMNRIPVKGAVNKTVDFIKSFLP